MIDQIESLTEVEEHNSGRCRFAVGANIAFVCYAYQRMRGA